jgi:hypothetical protein
MIVAPFVRCSADPEVNGIQEVVGSIPIGSTSTSHPPPFGRFLIAGVASSGSQLRLTAAARPATRSGPTPR